MRPHFIKTVSDWVEMQYNAQNYLEKAGKEFGEDYMRLSLRLTENYVDCFYDYLLFEYRPVFFYYKTGLEYFVEYNPQNLDKEIIAEYKEIWDTQTANVFEVKRIAEGAGIELFTKSLGDIFIHDAESFEGYEVGMLVWARVAKVKEKYFFVNDFVNPLSIISGVSKIQVLRPMSVQQVAVVAFADNEFLYKKERQQNEMLDKLAFESFTEFKKIQEVLVKGVKDMHDDFAKDVPGTDGHFKKAKKHFQFIRKQLKVEHLFTLETFDKWIDKEGDANLDFALRSLVFFVPEDFLERSEEHEMYVQAGQNYINSYLTVKRARKLLDGLSEIVTIKDLKEFNKKRVIDNEKLKYESMRDVQVERDGEDIKGKFMMKAYTWNDYQGLQFAGHGFLKDGKYKESKESYIKLMGKLLRDEVLFWPAFRVFANSASAHFLLGEFFMALGLVEASLRLNPKYDFAKMLKKNFLESVGSKKVKPEIPEMFYGKSVFAEYEKFLNAHEVNLNKKVEDKVIKFEIKDGEVSVPGKSSDK